MLSGHIELQHVLPAIEQRQHTKTYLCVPAYECRDKERTRKLQIWHRMINDNSYIRYYNEKGKKKEKRADQATQDDIFFKSSI